jgi:hypothetical protein
MKQSGFKRDHCAHTSIMNDVFSASNAQGGFPNAKKTTILPTTPVKC